MAKPANTHLTDWDRDAALTTARIVVAAATQLGGKFSIAMLACEAKVESRSISFWAKSRGLLV